MNNAVKKNKNLTYSPSSAKAVFFTSIHSYSGVDGTGEIKKQEAELIEYCQKRQIMPIRSFRENHLGLRGERPILRGLKRFLQNNNHNIDMVVFRDFSTLCETDQEIIDLVMEFSYLHVQLIPIGK